MDAETKEFKSCIEAINYIHNVFGCTRNEAYYLSQGIFRSSVLFDEMDLSTSAIDAAKEHYDKIMEQTEWSVLSVPYFLQELTQYNLPHSFIHSESIDGEFSLKERGRISMALALVDIIEENSAGISPPPNDGVSYEDALTIIEPGKVTSHLLGKKTIDDQFEVYFQDSETSSLTGLDPEEFNLNLFKRLVGDREYK